MQRHFFVLALAATVAACLIAAGEAFRHHHLAEPGDDFGGDDDGQTVIVRLKEKTKHSSSSSSQSSSESGAHSKAENRRWDHSSVSTADGEKVNSNTRVETREAGSRNAATDSRRSAGSGDSTKGRLLLNGREIAATNSGSSSSFEDSTNSSSASRFDKSMLVEIKREVEKQKLDLNCMSRMKVTLFLVIHLNENWRQKLLFVRQLIQDAYRKNHVEIACVLFNRDVNIFASFGPWQRGAESLIEELNKVERRMQISEEQENWRYFDLETAMQSCVSYANLFARRQATLLLSLFDYGVQLQPGLSRELTDRIGSLDIFNGRMCAVLQPVSDTQQLSQDSLREWHVLKQLLSTSPAYSFSAAREQNALSFMTSVVKRMCAAKFLN